MFMVVPNNKRVKLYIRSLNAAFDQGNELAALGGRPLVAVFVDPWEGRVCASGAECTPLIRSLPGLCTLYLLHLRSPCSPRTSAALRRRSQGGVCLPS